MRADPSGSAVGVVPPVHWNPNVYTFPWEKPKSTVSVESRAAIAYGSMPQAVHTGALIPATAIAAIDVLRLWPRLSRLQNSSGASADKLICTYLAVVPSAPPASDQLLSEPMAPAAVAK